MSPYAPRIETLKINPDINLSDRYRAVQAQHPEKTSDLHAVIIEAMKARRK